jgi:hypothetical protein
VAPDILGVWGSFAIGLVWGWLVGTRLIGMRHPMRTSTILAVASALVAAEVALVAGGLAVSLYAVGALLACGCELTWVVRLRAASERRHRRNS